MPQHRHVLIQCDAGPGVGLGHVSRCLAMAEALAEDGHDIFFLTGPHGRDALNMMGGGAFICLTPDTMRGHAPFDLAIADDYRLGEQEFLRLRDTASNLAIFDDMANRALACNWIINPAPNADDGRYDGIAAQGSEILSGLGYLALRAPIRRARRAALERLHHPSPNKTRRVLVSAGGVDGRGLAPLFTRAALAGQAGAVDVLMGGIATSLSTLRQMAAAAPQRMVLHVDHQDVAGLLQDCDLSIGPAGISLNEKLALGVPNIAVSVASNQDGLLAFYASQHLLRLVQLPDDPQDLPGFEARLTQAVSELAEDPALRADMARRGAAMVDALGARRIALALLPERDKQGRPIRLRPATQTDSAAILQWQCEPEARRYFRNPAPPTPQEHQAWMARVLADPERLCEIVLLDGEPCGMVRADPLDGADADAEVSILMAGVARGCGAGTAALRALHRLLRDTPLLAEVHGDNIASRRSFLSAGFEAVDAMHLRANAVT